MAAGKRRIRFVLVGCGLALVLALVGCADDAPDEAAEEAAPTPQEATPTDGDVPDVAGTYHYTATEQSPPDCGSDEFTLTVTQENITGEGAAFLDAYGDVVDELRAEFAAQLDAGADTAELLAWLEPEEDLNFEADQTEMLAAIARMRTAIELEAGASPEEVLAWLEGRDERVGTTTEGRVLTFEFAEEDEVFDVQMSWNALLHADGTFSDEDVPMALLFGTREVSGTFDGDSGTLVLDAEHWDGTECYTRYEGTRL